jgi:hypothetical protein
MSCSQALPDKAKHTVRLLRHLVSTTATRSSANSSMPCLFNHHSNQKRVDALFPMVTATKALKKDQDQKLVKCKSLKSILKPIFPKNPNISDL